MTEHNPTEVLAALRSTLDGHPDETAQQLLAELPAKQAVNRARHAEPEPHFWNRLHPARWSRTGWIIAIVTPLAITIIRSMS